MELGGCEGFEELVLSRNSTLWVAQEGAGHCFFLQGGLPWPCDYLAVDVPLSAQACLLSGLQESDTLVGGWPLLLLTGDAFGLPHCDSL